VSNAGHYQNDPLAPLPFDSWLPITWASAKRLIAEALAANNKVIWESFSELTDSIKEVGMRMSEYSEAVADVKAAVGEVATKLDQQADEIKALLEQVGADDAGKAAELRELAAQLRNAVANPDLPDAPPVEEPPAGDGSGDLPLDPSVDGTE
jgi:hypothetical protein